ncbi:MAG: hypothetical protein ACJAZS_000338 [Alteromonas naphthalenivorans]|jgi:hypothetical protein
MINRTLKLTVLLIASTFVAQNVQAKEPSLPKVKPYIPMAAKAIEVGAGKIESIILFELFDSMTALSTIDPRPCSKKMGSIVKELSSMIKEPKKYTQEQREKALENFFAWADSMKPEDNIVKFNDKKSLEKAADLLVNHSWSLPSQQFSGILMLQRLLTEGFASAFEKTDSTMYKEIKAANETIKRAHNHSVTEVTNALVVLEKNLSVFFVETAKSMESIDPKTFKMSRDFKEYQECLKFMPQPTITLQAPAQA